jgi:predicted RNase H-like HicB family nuclease
VKVREAIEMLQADGWELERQVGSHRQFRHPTKPGTVTVAGNLGRDLVIIEGSEDSYSAYVPDLPGCVAAGDSVEEVEQLIREAIPLHLESLRAHGEPIPPPEARASSVSVEAGA